LAKNEKLSTDQLKEITKIEATQKAIEKEKTGEYQAGTSQNIETLFGTNEAAKRQVIQGYASEYYQMQQAGNMLAAYKANRSNYDARNQIAGFLGISESKAAKLTDNELDAIFRERQNEIQDKLKDF
jgi:hypothetical protein